MAQAPQADPIFENPSVQEENRLPMRATYFAFESSTLAQQGNKEASSRFLNLNGTWKFHWVNHYDKLPSNFEKTDSIIALGIISQFLPIGNSMAMVPQFM